MHTATYDVAVASLDGQRARRHLRAATRLPGLDRGDWDKAAVLRYGENPHQRGRALPRARRRRARRRPSSCTARRCPTTTTSTPTRPAGPRTTSTSPAVAIIKHANPCGIAVGADVAEAHRKAHACDPVSAFGGVIATNRPVSGGDGRAGRRGLHRGDRGAGLRGRRRRGAAAEEEHPGARLPDRAAARRDGVPPDRRRPADAGARPRRRRRRRPGAGRWPAATPADGATLADLAFAWRACRVGEVERDPARPDGASVGVGMGQVNRVDSCRLAVTRAGERAAGLGGGVRRVLPVRRRAADPRSRPGSRRRPAGRLGARRRGGRGGRRPPA